MSADQITVPKHTVYRVKDAINDVADETYEKNYTLIADYLDELRRLNPGSHTNYQLEPGTNKFKRYFYSLGVMVKVATKACITMVQMDGAHSKHRKYNGCAFVLEGADGDGKNVILAIGLAPKENNENYDWFVGHCKQSGLGEWLDHTDQSIITDRHKGMPGACETFLKNVKHVNCMRHLIDNMRTAKLGAFHDDDIYNVQKAEHAPVFNTRMDALRIKNAKVAEYLARIPADKWAVHAIGRAMFGHRTSNRVESENSR